VVVTSNYTRVALAFYYCGTDTISFGGLSLRLPSQVKLCNIHDIGSSFIASASQRDMTRFIYAATVLNECYEQFLCLHFTGKVLFHRCEAIFSLLRKMEMYVQLFDCAQSSFRIEWLRRQKCVKAAPEFCVSQNVNLKYHP
jgi:hypothetical protein